MINRLIDEINFCLNSNCFMAALTTALTLPDICGKAEYGSIKPSERYIQWFDKYIGEDEKKHFYDGMSPYMNGARIWDLRNSVIHAEDPNINSKDSGIDEFNLLIQEADRCSHSGNGSLVSYHEENGKEVIDKTRYTISLLYLCDRICVSARDYYEKNKEKFDFIYRISIMDDNASKLLLSPQMDFRDVYQLDKKKTKSPWSKN